MSDSAGKRLAQARLARGLTIEEAAHATKMRPDKVLALENDDLSRFGSTAYAKGFLMLYARYLHVDVSDEVRALDAPHDLHIRDYQYLNNAPPPAAEERLPHFAQKQKTPSLAPLVAGAVLLVLVAFGFYLRAQAQRLDFGKKPLAAESALVPDETPVPGTALAQASAPVEAPAPVEESPVVEPPIPGIPMPVPAEAVAPPAEPVTSITGTAPEIRRAEPASPIALPPGEVVNEVVIAVRKKTWVQVRRGDAKSNPIFVDYLYPNDPPLKLRGARFFVEAREPDLIAIRKNGAPVPYTPGAPIE